MSINSDLHRENHSLKRQQSFIINQARKNEQKLQRIQQEELRFISAHSLYELIQQILVNYKTNSGLDFVTIALLDPEFEQQRILKSNGLDLNEHSSLIFFQTEEQLNQLFGLSLVPRLGPYNHDHHQFFFPQTEIQPSSVALLPLTRQGNLIGSLNLGSNNLDRFMSNAATDFLERLSAIVAICLENTLNNERLKHVGLTDSLTGINNRRFFDQRLNEEISRSKRTASPLTYLLLDIDFFKKINDNYGHQTGDRVLIDVADIIKSQLRDTDVLARYGGEEFSVLLTNTSIDDALIIAERIREQVASMQYQHNNEQSITVTISIGMSELHIVNKNTEDNTDIIQELFTQADTALYVAKENGRNQTRIHNAAPDTGTGTKVDTAKIAETPKLM